MMGKTTLALNLAVRMLNSNRKVVFFSMEMTPIQIMDRLMCIKTGLSNMAIRSQQLKKEDIEKQISAFEFFEKKKLYIEKTRTLENIETKLRKLYTEGNVDIVFIDYIQIMKTANAEKR